MITRSQYYQMESLVLVPRGGMLVDIRTELIRGQIVEMERTTEREAWLTDMLKMMLQRSLGDQFWVRSRAPLDVSEDSVPEPDNAVIPFNWEEKPIGNDNPKTALMVAEVSVATLERDRARKGSLYASVGIQNYWIVNYVHRCIEVYRDPVEDPAEEFGWRYASTTTHETGEIALLAVPTAKIEAAKLFP
jgi:Uma2 family endonuclease